MSKLTIIQLLNKIANGEDVPKKIKYNGEILKNNGYDNDYVDEDGDCLFQEYHWLKSLNENVEIIEEDKEIEKIELDGEYIVTYTTGIRQLMNTNKKDRDIYIKKINQLIDKVNSLEKKQ